MYSKEEYIQNLNSIIIDIYSDVYWCTRVSSAWSYNTMTIDDFYLVCDDTEYIEHISSKIFDYIKTLNDLKVVEDLSSDFVDAIYNIIGQNSTDLWLDNGGKFCISRYKDFNENADYDYICSVIQTYILKYGYDISRKLKLNGIV